MSLDPRVISRATTLTARVQLGKSQTNEWAIVSCGLGRRTHTLYHTYHHRRLRCCHHLDHLDRSYTLDNLSLRRRIIPPSLTLTPPKMALSLTRINLAPTSRALASGLPVSAVNHALKGIQAGGHGSGHSVDEHGDHGPRKDAIPGWVSRQSGQSHQSRVNRKYASASEHMLLFCERSEHISSERQRVPASGASIFFSSASAASIILFLRASASHRERSEHNPLLCEHSEHIPLLPSVSESSRA